MAVARGEEYPLDFPGYQQAPHLVYLLEYLLCWSACRPGYLEFQDWLIPEPRCWVHLESIPCILGLLTDIDFLEVRFSILFSLYSEWSVLS